MVYFEARTSTKVGELFLFYFEAQLTKWGEHLKALIQSELPYKSLSHAHWAPTPNALLFICRVQLTLKRATYFEACYLL